MKTSNRFKIIWWVILILVLSTIIYCRREFILNGTANGFDFFVFSILIAILLVPLFQEINFFGMQFKQAIEEVKKEVREELTQIRTEVRIGQSQNISLSGIPYPSPLSDEQLQKLEDRLGNLEDTIESFGYSRDEIEEVRLENISNDTLYLFQVRLNLEQEIRRIWELASVEKQPKRNYPIGRIIDLLIQDGVVYPQFANITREIYSICSVAIHGDEVTEKQLEFVRKNIEEMLFTWRITRLRLEN